MSVYFFDASAIVKRYVREVGSDWINQLIAEEQPRIFISSVSGPEVLAVMMRKGRTGEVDSAERDRVVQAFRTEFTTGYALISPEPTVIHKAMDLIEEHPLRAYDAVQLASVLSLPVPPHRMALTFVSADEGLLAVAQRRGLSTANPNLSP